MAESRSDYDEKLKIILLEFLELLSQVMNGL